MQLSCAAPIYAMAVVVVYRSHRRDTHMHSLRRVEKQCKSDEFAQISFDQAEELLDRVKSDFKNFQFEHLSIVSEVEDPEEYAGYEELYAEMQSLTSDLRVRLKQKMSDLKPAPPVQIPVETAPVRVELSATDMPSNHNTWGTFDGNFAEWLSFRDKFLAAVHTNERIKPVFKLQYLTKALVGKAKGVVGTRDVTEAGYEEAWKRLCEVYNDSYLIIHAHLSTLFELPKMERASYDGLRKIIDTTHEAIRQLKTLTVPVEHWDQILVFMLVERLDEVTFDAWMNRESANEARDVLPTLSALFEFLEKRSRSVIHIHPEQSRGNAKRNRDTVRPSNSRDNARPSNSREVTPNRSGGAMGNAGLASAASMPAKNFPPCRVCRGAHPLYKCGDFLALSLNGRKENVFKWKVCANCLREGHDAANCGFGPCLRCPNKRARLQFEQHCWQRMMVQQVVQSNRKLVTKIRIDARTGASKRACRMLCAQNQMKNSY